MLKACISKTIISKVAGVVKAIVNASSNKQTKTKVDMVSRFTGASFGGSLANSGEGSGAVKELCYLKGDLWILLFFSEYLNLNLIIASHIWTWRSFSLEGPSRIDFDNKLKVLLTFYEDVSLCEHPQAT